MYVLYMLRKTSEKPAKLMSRHLTFYVYGNPHDILVAETDPRTNFYCILSYCVQTNVINILPAVVGVRQHVLTLCQVRIAFISGEANLCFVRKHTHTRARSFCYVVGVLCFTEYQRYIVKAS